MSLLAVLAALGLPGSIAPVGVFRLASITGIESLPYRELSSELRGALWDLHWNNETKAFLDYGRHVSDGAIVEEVIVRCLRGEA